jgi:4-hydroxybenzoate polyprenyltransferase
VAARLAIAMLLLQFAVGTANDLADAPRDRVSHTAKPIPAGLVEARQAYFVFAVAVCGGLGVAASVGLAPLAVGLVGLADGLLYDLRLKGTVFSWLPFAAGVALLPVYAWVGATGALPAAFLAICPMALLAGAILALANALADLDQDRAAAIDSIATVLGRRRAIVANAVGLGLLQVAVVASSVAAGLGPETFAAEATGLVTCWVGARLSASTSEQVARLGWEAQAAGIVVLGAGWLAALGAARLL